MAFILVTVLWIASVCVHEYAHARVAYAGGDTSVAAKGYLTLNPLRYTHPTFSLLMPVVFLALGGIGLPGGAVYIDHSRLRSRNWESAVSAAGPAANVIIAVMVGLVFRFVGVRNEPIWQMIAFFGVLQVSSVVLNLLPVPPLDGYGIIAPRLDPQTREKFDQAGRFSLWGIFIVLFWVQPASDLFWRIVYGICDWMGIPAHMAWEGYNAFRSALKFG